jgi:hypothetical protein
MAHFDIVSSGELPQLKVTANKPIMQGSYEKMAYAVGNSKESSEEAPIFMHQWRALEDSNLWPYPPEGYALSS